MLMLNGAKEASISGVILAGGANKRFGGMTKANYVIDGVTIISRIISVIGDLFDEIIIVTNNPEEFREYLNCKIVSDIFKKAGPLGGIHAALKAASGDAVFIFASDMPFLNKKIIVDQINEYKNSDAEVVIPRVGEFIEPLHAVYRKSIMNKMEKFLSEKKSKAVRDFLSEVNVDYYEVLPSDESRRAFMNINSPSDLAGFLS